MGRQRRRIRAPMHPHTSSLVRAHTRGAVYVEFLIAFIPVLTLFLCLVQLALLYAARLLVDHAAHQAARAAAVVWGDEPTPYGEDASRTNKRTPARKRAVYNAALLSLAPLVLDGTVVGLTVAFPESPNGKDTPDDSPVQPMTFQGTHLTRVRIEAQVTCKLWIASVIMCPGAQNDARALAGGARTRSIQSEAAFPYQGASYAYAP